MTLRLVALISVVLLLSLAAFGLLMGYYQTQMVQVVADTASDVGRATLRALDLGEHEILLEGRVFGADEAMGKGLVTRVVPDDKVVVVPNGIDPSKFQKSCRVK